MNKVGLLGLMAFCGAMMFESGVFAAPRNSTEKFSCLGADKANRRVRVTFSEISGRGANSIGDVLVTANRDHLWKTEDTQSVKPEQSTEKEYGKPYKVFEVRPGMFYLLLPENKKGTFAAVLELAYPNQFRDTVHLVCSATDSRLRL